MAPGATSGTTSYSSSATPSGASLSHSASGSTGAVGAGTSRIGRRTSKVVGSSVYNEAKDDIGKVDDIIIPRGGGAPVAAISVGGFLGIGNRYVAVPLNELQFQNDRWTLARATKEYLRTLPPFSYDETTPRR
jgi:hypothetical protein